MASPQSTLQKVNSTAGSTHTHSTTPEKARNALFGVASVTTVSLATILDTIFPSVTSTQVDDVLQTLQAKGNLTSEGWTAFEALCSPKSKKAKKVAIFEPRRSSRNEDITFMKLEQVFEEVGQANASLHRDVADEDATSLETIEGNRLPIVTLSIHGNKNLAGDWPNSTRPDGSIHLKETALPSPRVVKIDIADICLMIQTKLHKTVENINDNRRKLLWNAHHKLRSDPRCRFATGITVENTQMQFWYLDRAGILVSSPFNFMTEPSKLIRIFLGYIVAPSEGALGFDTTIRRIGAVAEDSKVVPKPKKDGARVYDIEIHDSSTGITTVFRTIRSLANFGAVGICGRGTRVWEVVKVGGMDPERTYVLKDVWINENRVAEGVRLQRIRHDASPEELQFFLKIDCHGVVLNNDMGQTIEDTTFKYPISMAKTRTTLIQYEATAPPSLSTTDTSTNSVTRASASSNVSPSASRSSGASLSPRPIVQSSQGSDSGSSADLKKAFNTASQGSYATNEERPQALPARSACRRHYRIAFTDPPGCPIKDLTAPSDAFEALHGGLKAMKAMLRQGLIHRDISTGNILLIERGGEKVGVLMDLEYAKEFPGDSSTPHAGRTGTKQFMAVEMLSLTYMFQPRRKQYKLGWSHNPLHDVESTWWITVWILYYRARISLSDDDKQHRAKLFSAADTLARSIFFQYNSGGEGFIQKLPVTISKILDDWRIALLLFYEDQQVDLENDSHKSFNYDNVITDAIGRIESILIDLAANASVAPSLPL